MSLPLKIGCGRNGDGADGPISPMTRMISDYASFGAVEKVLQHQTEHCRRGPFSLLCYSELHHPRIDQTLIWRDNRFLAPGLLQVMSRRNAESAWLVVAEVWHEKMGSSQVLSNSACSLRFLGEQEAMSFTMVQTTKRSVRGLASYELISSSCNCTLLYCHSNITFLKHRSLPVASS